MDSERTQHYPDEGSDDQPFDSACTAWLVHGEKSAHIVLTHDPHDAVLCIASRDRITGIEPFTEPLLLDLDRSPEGVISGGALYLEDTLRARHLSPSAGPQACRGSLKATHGGSYSIDTIPEYEDDENWHNEGGRGLFLVDHDGGVGLLAADWDFDWCVGDLIDQHYSPWNIFGTMVNAENDLAILPIVIALTHASDANHDDEYPCDPECTEINAELVRIGSAGINALVTRYRMSFTRAEFEAVGPARFPKARANVPSGEKRLRWTLATELQFLGDVANGMSLAEIAAFFGVTPGTIKNHRHRWFAAQRKVLDVERFERDALEALSGGHDGARLEAYLKDATP